MRDRRREKQAEDDAHTTNPLESKLTTETLPVYFILLALEFGNLKIIPKPSQKWRTRFKMGLYVPFQFQLQN